MLEKIFENLEPKRVKDHFKIYIVMLSGPDDPILLELGRLRTLSYSKLGQGPKQGELDIDKFDLYYHHIIVWDDELKEIVGSYRISKIKDLFSDEGEFMSYSTENFIHSDEFLKSEEYLEIARSFIQPKYWSGNFLDHLWLGIGAYLLENPKLRYLYGTVTMGQSYSMEAITLVMQHYLKWYSFENKLIKPKYPIDFHPKGLELAKTVLVNNVPKKDELALRDALKEMGNSIPVLLRKYFGITDYGGTSVIEVGEDPSYRSYSMFIRMDMEKLRDIYEKRYLIRN